MALVARHPDEVALHHELRDALNKSLLNSSFFVWIDVRPTGERKAFVDVEAIIADTERWLASLDPDAASDGANLRELHLVDPAADVKVSAIPKKRSARSRRADQIVGNPEPVLAGWT
jgi:hypothetical protein